MHSLLKREVNWSRTIAPVGGCVRATRMRESRVLFAIFILCVKFSHLVFWWCEEASSLPLSSFGKQKCRSPVREACFSQMDGQPDRQTPQQRGCALWISQSGLRAVPASTMSYKGPHRAPDEAAHTDAALSQALKKQPKVPQKQKHHRCSHSTYRNVRLSHTMHFRYSFFLTFLSCLALTSAQNDNTGAGIIANLNGLSLVYVNLTVSYSLPV